MIISTTFSIRFAFHRGGKKKEIEMQMRQVWKTGETNRKQLFLFMKGLFSHLLHLQWRAPQSDGGRRMSPQTTAGCPVSRGTHDHSDSKQARRRASWPLTAPGHCCKSRSQSSGIHMHFSAHFPLLLAIFDIVPGCLMLLQLLVILKCTQSIQQSPVSCQLHCNCQKKLPWACLCVAHQNTARHRISEVT